METRLLRRATIRKLLAKSHWSVFLRCLYLAACKDSQYFSDLSIMFPVLIGISGIALTVTLHAFTSSLVLSGLKWYAVLSRMKYSVVTTRPMILGGTATALATKHYLDITLYAAAYWYFEQSGRFADFESALYLSSVTYTTLGYGDIVLTDSWRLLCGIQAMNGILLFGWSTALLFFLVQKLWFTKAAIEHQGAFKRHFTGLHHEHLE